MKKWMSASLIAILGAAVLLAQVHAQPAPPDVGEPLPDIVLQGPADQADKEYLGLSGQDAFQVKEIKAPLVIIEIFSMYCPYCQREAPSVNRLYDIVQADPELSGRVKIIGIGAGNTPFEVEVFKTKYQVPFPLFDDENYNVHKIIGKVRTPYFIVAASLESGQRRVAYSQAGGFEDLDGFLDFLKQTLRGD